MMTRAIREVRFSKNMATINYWMCQQNFIRYDSLFWSTVDGVTQLFFDIGKPVAKVTWCTILKGSEEYHVPMFEFLGEYAHWNGNQLSFWIHQNLISLIEDSL